MITLDGRAFEHFLLQKRNHLRRIVRQSPDRIEMCEVESEAWLVAQALSDRRGRALDFRDADDQDALVGRLFAQLVKWTGTSVRSHGKRDQSLDDEDQGAKLANFLRAPHDTDPEIRQLFREEREEFLETVRASYSQAAAYMLLLIRVEWELRDLASLLWIGVATLRARIARCVELSGVQPTLFDGIDHIDPGFTPTRRMGAAPPTSLGRPPSIGYPSPGAQLGMRFAADA
jgi:hypothetical protein